MVSNLTKKEVEVDFSDKVRKLREGAGLTQEELAKKLGVSRPAVGMWESKRSRPRLDKMNQLADLFGVPVSELLGEAAQPNVVGTSAFVPLRTLGSVHMGDLDEEPNPDHIVEVPRHVIEEVSDPDAYAVRMHGACMNRRYPEDCDALISPNTEPTDGASVIASYNGEQICRVYRKGARAFMLSPDSYDDSFEDLVFDDPDNQTVEFQGVVRWFQASRVEP